MSELKETIYSQLGEKIYQAKLTNGLQVVLIPKEDYHEVFGAITTKFGAQDTLFRPKNRKLKRTFPAGLAHFLEHCLFHLKGGQDVTERFAEIGSSVNAFTGFDQTTYYVSSFQEVSKALTLLQEFTARPNFNQEGLLREKDIIGQEIRMYQDDPDYQLYQSILAQLYPDSPLAKDIAGDEASIDQITLPHLRMAFDIFYQPSNMLLLLVGNFKPEEMFREIVAQQNKGRRKKEQSIERGTSSLLPVRSSTSKEMVVEIPKLAVGLRGKDNLTQLSRSHYRLALRLFFAMILGWTSSTYQKWYQQGKIDNSFLAEVEVTKDYQFLVISLDTTEPLAMSKRIRQLLLGFERLEDLTEGHLEMLKKEFYGDFIKSLNRIETLAMDYTSAWAQNEDFFELPVILKELSLKDVLEAGQDFIKNGEMTDFIIFPK